MFSCCTRCSRPRDDAGTPERSPPGSPAPLSPGDEAEAGLLGAEGAGGDASAAWCLRPRSVAAALLLVVLAGAAAAGAVQHRHFAHSRNGDVHPVLQMLEEDAQGTMEEGHQKDQEEASEQTLLGFLKDMERKKGSKSPEAEEAETKDVLTKFMVKIQKQRNTSKVQPRNKQTQRQIDGFLKEMEHRQSEPRDESQMDGNQNLSEKVHALVENIIADQPGPPKLLHAAKEAGTASPKVQLGRSHRDRQAKRSEGRNTTSTSDANSSFHEDRKGHGPDGENISSLADANSSSHEDAKARRYQVTTNQSLKAGVSLQPNGSSVTRGEREKMEEPGTQKPMNSSTQHKGSCEAYGCMGYDTANTCQCNKRCKEYDNCCSDYAETCGASSLGQARHTCELYGCVHYEPSHACQCNEGCSTYQDCCPDFREQCVIDLK